MRVRLKRRTFELFRRLAERVEVARGAGERSSLLQRLGLALGEILVYGPVRDQLGLRRARWAYTGGAPLGPDTYRFFRSFGINLKQVWGSTELSGLAALQRDGEADPDTVGPAIPGSEIRIADNRARCWSAQALCSRAITRSPRRRATRSTPRAGSAPAIAALSTGAAISSSSTAPAMSASSPTAPRLRRNSSRTSSNSAPTSPRRWRLAIERPFVAAMIAIDLGTVGNWAERRNLAYTSFQDLSAKPEIRRLIGDEIARCNAGLPAAARIRRFLLLSKEFDADDNEITRTRKVRRRFIAEKYAAAVEAFYGGGDAVELATEITYEDGRKGRARRQDGDRHHRRRGACRRAPRPIA